MIVKASVIVSSLQSWSHGTLHVSFPEFGMDLNEDDASNSSGSHLVRKNIPLKLKQSKSRGRGRKPASPRTRRSGSRKRDERDHEDEPTGTSEDHI